MNQNDNLKDPYLDDLINNEKELIHLNVEITCLKDSVEAAIKNNVTFIEFFKERYFCFFKEKKYCPLKSDTKLSDEFELLLKVIKDSNNEDLRKSIENHSFSIHDMNNICSQMLEDIKEKKSVLKQEIESYSYQLLTNQLKIA